jgi:hypothetical protein
MYKDEWMNMKKSYVIMIYVQKVAPLWPPHKPQIFDEGHHLILMDPNWTPQESLG